MDKKEMDFLNAKMLRRKAEMKLKEDQERMKAPASENDVKKLLHELQVHQIELELQNEELRMAYNTTEEALKKYTMLYDFAPMGYLTLDYDGSICELNFTAAELLDEKRFSLVNSNFKLFIAEASLPVFNDFLSRVYTSSSKESCQVMLGYDKKPLCQVYIEGVVTDDEKKCLLSVVDISGFAK